MKMAQNTGAGCFLLRIRKVVWGGEKLNTNASFSKNFPLFTFKLFIFFNSVN